jgi:2,3-bisphosphoglycerate-independent phosphoglycerate mutase
MENAVSLVICDGFGLSAERNGNAILQSPTPTLDYLLQNYPAMRLLAAGTEVGLDPGEPGNSEVGHLTLGTGQVLPQAFQIINGSIKSEAYKQNPVFLQTFDQVVKTPNATLHMVGLVSAGGVHGHIDHMTALLTLAKERGVQRVVVHAITDGRDSPPRVALQDLQRLTPILATFSNGRIGSVSGRMDRDHNWERTDAAYWAMAGISQFTAPSAESAVQAAYDRGESDENLHPTVIAGNEAASIKEGDVVVFTNYRPDRIRQLSTRVLTQCANCTVVTLTDYFLEEKIQTAAGTTLASAYPLPKPEGTLSRSLADAHKSQLHIAETEKYAHITYFFNGHEERKQAQEQWLLVPSVKVDSFDKAPEMSAAQITAAYINAAQHHSANFTTINYANMDMVGHTGNFEATCKAVSAVDAQLKAVIEQAEQSQEWLFITADHGNAEQMIHPVSGEVDKEHTVNPVPLIVVHPSLKRARSLDKHHLAAIGQTGILADVAPTILELFNITKTPQMVGTSLLPQLQKI